MSQAEIPRLRSSESPGLFCLDDGVPWETIAALRGACEARDLAFRPLDAPKVQAWHLAPLPAGSLLYTPATSARALAIEERLWGRNVATVYPGEFGPLQQVHASTAAFLYAGVATPRAVPSNTSDRDHLDAAAAAVGGFPLVLRFGGYSVGEGILRVDSSHSLYSAIDHAAARGVRPEIVEWIADAQSWRVVVVGGRAIGATLGRIPAGDFRSRTSDDEHDYLGESDVPAPMAELAVAAARAVHSDAAGVDILRAPDGCLYALEANTPFYFGHLQARGIDVAGAIVDHLLAVGWQLRESQKD